MILILAYLLGRQTANIPNVPKLPLQDTAVGSVTLTVDSYSCGKTGTTDDFYKYPIYKMTVSGTASGPENTYLTTPVNGSIHFVNEDPNNRMHLKCDSWKSDELTQYYVVQCQRGSGEPSTVDWTAEWPEFVGLENEERTVEVRAVFNHDNQQIKTITVKCA